MLKHFMFAVSALALLGCAPDGVPDFDDAHDEFVEVQDQDSSVVDAAHDVTDFVETDEPLGDDASVPSEPESPEPPTCSPPTESLHGVVYLDKNDNLAPAIRVPITDANERCLSVGSSSNWDVDNCTFTYSVSCAGNPVLVETFTLVPHPHDDGVWIGWVDLDSGRFEVEVW